MRYRKSASIRAWDPEGESLVRRIILDRLLEARAAKRPAAHLRWLEHGDEALVVAGEVIVGEPLPQEVLDAVRAAHRRDRGTMVATERGPLFIQVFNPPLRLLVIGAVHIAQALVPMASLAGYDVTVIDPRRAFASDARFPGVDVRQDWPDEALEALKPDARTAVVTLTHDPKLDDPALDVALRSEAFYIAALGSKRTHAGRLERLAELGHDQAALGRIHGPAGLAIGAVSPAEVAISVLAEMTRELRQGGSD
jgi:xanthine dehydrogenase accessory factor